MVSRMSQSRFPMKMVSQRTGLSAHVLRVWERRYGAVSPDRTESNRRLYSKEEVRRLELMAMLTRGGHNISQIAQLSAKELEALANELPEGAPDADSGGHTNRRPGGTALEAFRKQAWAAVVNLDGAGLESVLESVTRELGGSAMIEKLVVPLVGQIGEAWDSGEISVAHERATSTVIQEALLVAGRPHSETCGAPVLVAATPAGQVHELGASLVVCTARRRGWAVTYLGSSIPAEEIAHTAKTKGATAVALSLVYPSDDKALPAELKRLKRLLPDSCSIVAGGRAAPAYAKALDKIGAQHLTELGELKDWLDSEREAREAG